MGEGVAVQIEAEDVDHVIAGVGRLPLIGVTRGVGLGAVDEDHVASRACGRTDLVCQPPDVPPCSNVARLANRATSLVICMKRRMGAVHLHEQAIDHRRAVGSHGAKRRVEARVELPRGDPVKTLMPRDNGSVANWVGADHREASTTALLTDHRDNTLAAITTLTCTRPADSAVVPIVVAVSDRHFPIELNLDPAWPREPPSTVIRAPITPLSRNPKAAQAPHHRGRPSDTVARRLR